MIRTLQPVHRLAQILMFVAGGQDRIGEILQSLVREDQVVGDLLQAFSVHAHPSPSVLCRAARRIYDASSSASNCVMRTAAPSGNRATMSSSPPIASM
jgi:hypothetical protein